MRSKPIESDLTFICSLDSRQRAYFLQREGDRSSRLQESLRALAHGISVVSALNGETLEIVLGAES